jgi:tetratricopeptide (TPR) repeat protein
MRIRLFGPLFSLIRRRPVAAAVAALLLLASAGAAGWYGWRSYTYYRHRQAADLALEHYDLDAARDELAACVQMNPRDAELRLLAAQTARRAGFPDEAEAHLNAYQDIQGKATPDGALERALLTAQDGRLEEVRDQLRSRLEIHHPASARILEAMAQGAVVVYHLGEAMPLLDEWLRREPGNVQALTTRGLLFESVGQREQALDDYREAVRREPDHVPARLRLAEALLRDHRPREAREHFMALRGRRPHDAAVLIGLARCHEGVGDREAARQVLDDLLRDHPDDGDALLERGKLAMELESPEAAEPLLRRAANLMPSERLTHYHLALCLQKLGRTDEAAPHEKRLKEMEADAKLLEELYQLTYRRPKDPEPRLEAGQVCMRNGQEREGLRWMYGALQCDPHHRPTHEALADYYERHGDKAAAAEHRRANAPAGLPPELFGGRR